MKYDNEKITSDDLREIHKSLLRGMHGNIKRVCVQQEMKNFGNPYSTRPDFRITVFYPDYPDGSRTCEGWDGPDINKLIAKARRFIKKEYS